MADEPSDHRSERPRSEPEIIPPGAPLRRPRDDPFADSGFTQRIYVTRLGPFGLVALALARIVAVVLLILVVGAVLFWIPIVGLIVAAAIIASVIRSRFQ